MIRGEIEIELEEDFEVEDRMILFGGALWNDKY